MANRLIELTARDQEIVSTLTHSVRVLTVSQVGRTWWAATASPEVNARRRLRSLEHAGLITSLSLIAHPEITLPGPVVTWQRRFPEPDASELASALARRWTEPERETHCAVATDEAAARFGGNGGRPPRESEATHDIHLSAVYLRMVQELPTRASSWIPEATLKKGQGIKVPDAMVRDGKHKTAIEFGGAYSRQKLADFHRHCQGRGLAYELW